MATTKRRKKIRKKKAAAPKKKVARKKKKAAPAAKEGFPTPRSMKAARDKFADEAGTKILTASKVKELTKSMGLRVSTDFADALAKKVYVDVFKAAKRCVSNDRKTIRPDDL